MAAPEVLFTGDAVSPDGFSQTAYVILHANIGFFTVSLVSRLFCFCLFKRIPFGNLSASLQSISFSVCFLFAFFFNACPCSFIVSFFISLFLPVYQHIQ